MIERALAFLNAIPDDKVRHALGGVVIFAICYHTLMMIGLPLDWRMIGVALAIVAAIAALKELYDLLHKPHTPDVFDFVATLLGGVLGAVCTF